MGITNPNDKLPVALIAGPTASGKTALALRLTEQGIGTIINADSAQVYAHLSVLSAQPTPTEMASVPHRLFGYKNGIEFCSAADWSRDARAAISEAHDNGRLPILVGGTGLYLRTLLDGIAPVPEIDFEVRRTVRLLSTEAAYAALRDVDAKMAARLHSNDDSRIKRALEVKWGTGRSLLQWREEKHGGISDQINLQPLILLPPRPWLHSRCDRRFEQMMENGAVQEVEALIGQALPKDAPVMRAIGVPEISAMLHGKYTRDEAVTCGQAATRQYAKRQYTWFRNQTPSDWTVWNEEVNNDKMDKIVTLFQ
jgi:tRNA dimethylallyltransferase